MLGAQMLTAREKKIAQTAKYFGRRWGYKRAGKVYL